jgi:hypothetical protein
MVMMSKAMQALDVKSSLAQDQFLSDRNPLALGESYRTYSIENSELKARI